MACLTSFYCSSIKLRESQGERDTEVTVFSGAPSSAPTPLLHLQRGVGMKYQATERKLSQQVSVPQLQLGNVLEK